MRSCRQHFSTTLRSQHKQWITKERQSCKDVVLIKPPKGHSLEQESWNRRQSARAASGEDAHRKTHISPDPRCSQGFAAVTLGSNFMFTNKCQQAAHFTNTEPTDNEDSQISVDYEGSLTLEAYSSHTGKQCQKMGFLYNIEKRILIWNGRLKLQEKLTL